MPSTFLRQSSAMIETSLLQIRMDSSITIQKNANKGARSKEQEDKNVPSLRFRVVNFTKLALVEKRQASQFIN